MTPEIIYEDDNIIAFNKKSGMLVHHDTYTKSGTLSDWLKENRPEIENVGENMEDQKGNTIERPGIVHRLDRETSGVIVVSKNKETFMFLKNAFKEREIKKVYKAIVYGRVGSDSGVINSPIGRSKSDFRKEVIGEGRVAETGYKVLKRAREYTYLEAYPKTGRTHQIRVHLKSLGNPVVCDTLYAPKKECPSDLGRLALHAYQIEIPMPDGSNITILADEPKEFGEFLAQ